MKELGMKLGQNIGEILLDIAQTKIMEGNPEESIQVFTRSLMGISREQVLEILKGESSLKVADNQVEILFCPAVESKTGIIDWEGIVGWRLSDLKVLKGSLRGIRESFDRVSVSDILNYRFDPSRSIYNLAAKLIAGDDFSGQTGDGEDIWGNFVQDVEDEVSEGWETALFLTVKYVSLVKELGKTYLDFTKSYDFLVSSGFISRPRFIEYIIEDILDYITKFCNPHEGYYHPMCNTKLREYKVWMMDRIKETRWGKEYLENNGLLEKNIMDGYDAGWLSPEGKFYGENGPTSNLIHLNLADRILDGRDLNKDLELEKRGWLKIHHEEVYGSFKHYKNDTAEKYCLYCPTDIQIRLVCSYIDKYYGGILYTEPSTFGSRTQRPNPVKTSALRQMDEIMLHEAFGI
jgi:hypothetical protein